MNLAPSLSLKLGVVRTPAGKPPQFDPGSCELRFRKEVAQLVHDLLQKHYVNEHDATREIAYRRRMTVEQLMAATIAHLVMKKVDEEYL